MDSTPYSIFATDLLSALGTHRAPCLIDVCLADDIAAAPWRLPGATHLPHPHVQDWAQVRVPQTPVVVICQKGLKLSHGAAARLRSLGFDAYALSGGNLGWFAEDHPRLALDTAPATGTTWVLPAPCNTKTLSAAWVIRRWYDPTAPLLWVPAEHVRDVAARFDAHALELVTPLAAAFDARGLEAGHLADFLATLASGTSPAAPLLDVLHTLHQGDQEMVEAALPLLDVAWMAFRQSSPQEAT